MFRSNHTDITIENVPCWYEIAWDNGQILLKVREEFFAHFKDFFAKLPQTPIATALRENLANNGYELGDVSADPKTGLGFSNKIAFLKERDSFWIYAVPLPKKDLDAFQVSASLTQITHLLELFNLETGTRCGSFQRLTFTTNTDVGMYGAPILGKVSIPLRRFLDQAYREQNNGLKITVNRTMVEAWRRMYGGASSYEKNRLSFSVRKSGFFHLDCPGDACGLDPGHSYRETLDQGYDFCPHNTDSPKQQLTLLAGLAAILTFSEKE